MIEDVVHGWASLDAAAPGYLKAKHYYEGDVDEVFSSVRIRAAIAETGLRYRFNLAKTPVETLADRVELVAVTAPDQASISERIEEVWDANDMDVHYPDLILRTFEFGDGYLGVFPLEQEDDEAQDDPEAVAAGVEIVYHSPLNNRMIYDPENGRRKLFFIKRWPVFRPGVEEPLWRVDLWYPDMVERWISKTGGDLKRAEGWQEYTEPDEDGADWELVNPFGEIPFFHHRNALPYGKPVHFAAYGCQDAINKSLITQLTTMDSHGFPQRYRLIDQDSATEGGAPGPDFPDDADAATGNGSLVGGEGTGLRGGPGTMLELVGKGSVGQFPAADPTVFLDPASFYVRLMAQLTSTPLHYFDPSGEVPSGESLKVADAPLTKSAERAHVMLRGTIVETWSFILRLLGVQVDRLDVRWAPAQVATGTDDWNVIETKQRAGVPQHQTLVEAGYESEQVMAWLDQEGEAMDLARRLALLNTMADAIQKLGAGVGLGVIDEATAQQIIAQIVPQTMPAPGTEEAS